MTAEAARERPRVRALALHTSYRCGRSGVCCSSGWAIPVEPEIERSLRSAMEDGRLRLGSESERATAPVAASQAAARGAPGVLLPLAAGLPYGARAVLGRGAGGGCAFLETGAPRLCAIHRQLGETALPSACRQFPRIAVHTPLGTGVTLSHYCPTAAGLLFQDQDSSATDPLLRIVEDPPTFARPWPIEGLDARQALPPLLRPGVLMSWPSHEAWERHLVAQLSRPRPPEAVLDDLHVTAERLRAWTLERGEFDPYLESVLADAPLDAPSGRVASPRAAPGTLAGEALAADALAAWDRVAQAIPALHARPASPRHAAGLAPADSALSLVAEGWARLSTPIRRWVAAKAFASWLALQGEGLRTSVLGLRIALAVLRAEAIRGCAGTGSPLDGALLGEAIRRADLLLAHLVDPQALARSLGRCELGA